MILGTARLRRPIPSTRARLPVMRRRRRAATRGAVVPMTGAAAASGIALGAVLEYFLDPSAGRRRRHGAKDRAMSRIRRGERRAISRARRTESHAVGVARRAVNALRPHAEQFDDVTLAHKVESELYRRAGVPKGRISINAEDGVVFLRGVLDRREDIDRIGMVAIEIRGVRGVENLVHMPGTPAPASRPKLARERAWS